MAGLQALLGSLAREDGVFGRVAEADTVTAEEHVYRLVLDAHEAWAGYAVNGARGPSGPVDLRGALQSISAEQATEVMAYLSAGCLGLPGPDAP